MTLIKSGLKTNIVLEESTNTYGRIVVEPLEKGYGITVGNALRRVLLSSIEGAAISAIRIDGVVHEFSTIPGVREDVVEIMLNLKKIAVRSHSDDVKILRLEVTGPKEVKASDIMPDSQVEFINPEAYICTLAEDHSLLMELYVEKGRGYKLADRPRPKYLPLDAIVMDAIFSPVLRVNYKVESSRVGQRTDYDKLVLEIWTNGVVSPEEALREAGAILVEQFIPFSKFNLPEKEIFVEVEPKTMEEEKKEDSGLLSRSIKELDLSVRSENCLLRAGIKTIGDLVACTREDLLGIRNLGRVSLKEIEQKLDSLGLKLRESTSRRKKSSSI